MGDMQLKPELVQELCAFARERKIQKTLLFFDVIDLERPLPEAFRAEIVKDGVVLYEEIR